MLNNVKAHGIHKPIGSFKDLQSILKSLYFIKQLQSMTLMYIL